MKRFNFQIAILQNTWFSVFVKHPYDLEIFYLQVASVAAKQLAGISTVTGPDCNHAKLLEVIIQNKISIKKIKNNKE